MRALIVILVVMGAISAQSNGETDKSTIEAVVAQFTEAWNRHDAHSFTAVFTEYADLTNWRGTHARVRKTVEGFHAPMFASAMFKDSHLNCQLRSVRFLKPDVAIAGRLGDDGR